MISMVLIFLYGLNMYKTTEEIRNLYFRVLFSEHRFLTQYYELSHLLECVSAF